MEINLYRLQNKTTLPLRRKSLGKRGHGGVKTDYTDELLIRMSRGQLMLSHFIIQILIIGIYNSKLLQQHFCHCGKRREFLRSCARDSGLQKGLGAQ